MTDRSGLARLSPSQRRVYDSIAAGSTAKETAASLGLSVRTVEDYCATIRDRLGLAGGPVTAIREHGPRTTTTVDGSARVS
jgi:FixJ family two-component response regulator